MSHLDPRLKVSSVDCVSVDLPYKPLPAIYMASHWGVNFRRRRHVCRLTLSNGVVGFGEGGVSHSTLSEVIRRSTADLLWDDSVGAGLQMALFDAVGKTREVPVHRLLGERCRDRMRVAWTSFPMPPDAWKAECQEAVQLGYNYFRGKAWPWFDLREQYKAALSAAEDISFGFDFNSWLLTRDRARDYLQSLEATGNVYMFEEPLPTGDISGNRHLRTSISAPLVLHWEQGAIETASEEETCDALVVGGGAKEILTAGKTLAAASRPFFLEVVGSGLTTAYCAHFASVLSHATLPAVNLSHVFATDLIEPGCVVENGYVKVPEGPGLGVSINEESLERYRIEPGQHGTSNGDGKLFALRWSSSSVSYYAKIRQCKRDLLLGEIPGFAPGVPMEEIPDDGTPEWARLQARAAEHPVHDGKVPAP